MEVSIHDTTDIEKEISILATAEELEPHFEKAYKRFLPNIEVKGFRKGKVPLDIVKKIHGESIEYRALDTIASDVYRQVIEERNIHPVGDPVLTDMDYKRGEALSFKIKYEIKPTVKLQQYKNLSVEKPVHAVTDQEVEDEISRIRRANSTTTEVPSVTDEEHIVIADIQQLDEGGTPLIGKKENGLRLYLAGGTMYQEIKDALRHASVGETKRVKFESERDGQKTPNHIEINIKKIEKVDLPEFNDGLVKKITKDKMTSAEEFRTSLRKDIETYWTEMSDRKVEDTLISEIVRKHEFPVPEAMVKGILDSLVEDMKSRYPNKKLPADFKEEEFRTANRELAVFQGKWYLIREQIIGTEGIDVTDDDINLIVETESAKTGIDKERLKTFYQSSTAVKDKILSQKLIKFLKDHSTITEKVSEDTTA